MNQLQQLLVSWDHHTHNCIVEHLRRGGEEGEGEEGRRGGDERRVKERRGGGEERRRGGEERRRGG